MNKQEYIQEMLSEILELYSIPPEVLQECSEAMVHGLDVWYELSGDSVASSNRYASLEDEKKQAVKKKDKELQEAEKRHEETMQEADRNARWIIQKYQQRIEELEKQVK